MEEQPLLKKKIYYNKKGEEVIRYYDQTLYNKKYYEKNLEKLKEHIDCDCGLKYLPSNKSNHCLGRIHRLWEKLSKEKETLAI